MDSPEARKFCVEHGNAIVNVDGEAENGALAIGSVFHIGEGDFVTARHLVENRHILEIDVTEPGGVSSCGFFLDIMQVDVSNGYSRQYDETLGAVTGHPPLSKHYLRPLEICEGPCFAEKASFEVAAYRVHEIRPAGGVTQLGVHRDNWVYRGLRHLSDAIVLGYPRAVPVPRCPKD